MQRSTGGEPDRPHTVSTEGGGYFEQVQATNVAGRDQFLHYITLGRRTPTLIEAALRAVHAPKAVIEWCQRPVVEATISSALILVTVIVGVLAANAVARPIAWMIEGPM